MTDEFMFPDAEVRYLASLSDQPELTCDAQAILDAPAHGWCPQPALFEVERVGISGPDSTLGVCAMHLGPILARSNVIWPPRLTWIGRGQRPEHSVDEQDADAIMHSFLTEMQDETDQLDRFLARHPLIPLRPLKHEPATTDPDPLGENHVEALGWCRWLPPHSYALKAVHGAPLDELQAVDRGLWSVQPQTVDERAARELFPDVADSAHLTRLAKDEQQRTMTRFRERQHSFAALARRINPDLPVPSTDTDLVELLRPAGVFELIEFESRTWVRSHAGRLDVLDVLPLTAAEREAELHARTITTVSREIEQIAGARASCSLGTLAAAHRLPVPRLRAAMGAAVGAGALCWNPDAATAGDRQAITLTFGPRDWALYLVEVRGRYLPQIGAPW